MCDIRGNMCTNLFPCPYRDLVVLSHHPIRRPIIIFLLTKRYYGMWCSRSDYVDGISMKVRNTTYLCYPTCKFWAWCMINVTALLSRKRTYKEVNLVSVMGLLYTNKSRKELYD